MLGKGFLKEADLEPDIGPFYPYISAFHSLSTSRSFGFGPGPIPIDSAIVFWEHLGKDLGDSFGDFWFYIQKMDNAYLTKESEKRERTSKEGKKPRGRKSTN